MIYFLIFFLGTAVGSFLNVLIYRLPREEEVVRKRSHCTSCGTPLLWYDLIPLFSWLLLRGRCRYCKAKISWQYPLVELTSGILFVLGYLFTENSPTIVSIFSADVAVFINLLFVWWVLSALLVIFVVDLKHFIIPDKILYPTILVVLAYQLAQLVAQGSRFNVQGLFPPGTSYHLPVAVLSALGAAGFFLLLVLVTRGKGMGMGDVKLAALMGLLLGYPAIIVALYISFLTGAVVSVILLLLGKRKFGQHIPFGPFLVLGTIVGLYYGREVWGMFVGFY